MDLQHSGAHSGIFREADIVEGLAEDGPVVVLVDEVDLHAREADVVGDALVCKELGGEARRELELLQNYPFLKKKLMQKITPSLLAVANLNGLHPITLSLALLSRPYRKLVAGNGLEVQWHGHADADVRLPLDGGGRDDEVVGVVAHQVDLKNAVGALKERRGRPVTRGAQLGASLKDSLLVFFLMLDHRELLTRAASLLALLPAKPCCTSSTCPVPLLGSLRHAKALFCGSEM